MNQRAERRKKNQRVRQTLFYDAISDRRRAIDRRGQPPVVAPPGAIRPAANEEAPAVERRRVPGSANE